MDKDRNPQGTWVLPNHFFEPACIMIQLFNKMLLSKSSLEFSHLNYHAVGKKESNQSSSQKIKVGVSKTNNPGIISW